MQIDPQNVGVIFNRPQSTSLYHVRSFFRFFTFYWRFIWDFSTRLTKRDTIFDRLLAYQFAFNNWRKMAAKALIRAHYISGLKTIFEKKIYPIMFIIECDPRLATIKCSILLHSFIRISTPLNIITRSIKNSY